MGLSFLLSWRVRIQVSWYSSIRSSFRDLRALPIIARNCSSNAKQIITPKVNSLGETILINEDLQLPGYAFVPLKNKFMLRQCRRLIRASNDSRTVFVQHASPRQPNDLGPELGIYAPCEIIAQVSAEFAKLTALLDRTIWKKWEHEYPQMPAADKSLLQRLVSEKNADAVAKCSTHVAQSTLWGYVSRTYTSDEHLVLSTARNPKAALRMREKIDGVLQSWRG
ncbi:hypothetical protein HCBG_01204 [Histoplasma capsulatum G186AR]|uniref:DUF2293 domain-containing protein n=2 Tax=Ajellomyces capsulatus TaxID=5037 RepID=C0NA45_AJECG|nr:uncharacterized protein HCBG_01204 [Histoplasma capsulatum G186AR]EEH11749.1 hypothetical protein HCBG_01204 [Histoplasma capsulatum G186AR]KAG5302391.1 hypothetical protein I7I52_00019 [Histoplasma capsulatum]QSS72211.1 hypothetical protein I7I50_03313 [Histoplasma capsulatum G186AR]